MRGTLITAICLLGLAPLLTRAEETNTVQSFRDKYDALTAGIEKDCQKQKTNALAAYAETLKTLLQTLKGKGDLDAYLGVEKEQKRFDAEASVPAVIDASEPTVVMQAVARYRAAVDAAEADKTKRQIDLLKRYTAGLSALVKKDMVQERIDDAKLAKAEFERAQTILALYETRPAPVQPVQAETVENGQSKTATDPAPPPASPNPAAGKPVPAEAVSFKGHHYKLFGDGADWNTAQLRCRTQGGHLVVIQDGEEDGFVYNLMRGHRAAWIGAELALGTWRWVTSTAFEYRNWAPGQPNGGKGGTMKACIYGDWRDNEDIRGQWDDRPGNNAEVTAYVCEWDY